MRYDLIERIQNPSEKELFDYFERNLPLREGMKISKEAILTCELRHRLAFV